MECGDSRSGCCWPGCADASVHSVLVMLLLEIAAEVGAGMLECSSAASPASW